VFIEKGFDFISILLQDLVSLVIESLLNVCKLVTVVLSHSVELLSHCLNEIINVTVLLFESLHILLILHLQLFHEGLYQVVLLVNYLLALAFLLFDFLYRD
jgi:hypothetical protein